MATLKNAPFVPNPCEERRLSASTAEAPWQEVIQRLRGKRGLSRAEHTELMHAWLARHLEQARGLKFIIGIEVQARDDFPCPRAKGLAGFYLLDEIPDLYPSDCPGDEDSFCACIFYNSVMDRDIGPGADMLRRRLAQKK